MEVKDKNEISLFPRLVRCIRKVCKDIFCFLVCLYLLYG